MNGQDGRSLMGDLTQDYRTTLLRFLPRQDEAARAAAYELGRRAFSAGGEPAGRLQGAPRRLA